MSFIKTIEGEVRHNSSRKAIARKIKQAAVAPSGATISDDFAMKNGYLYTVVRAISARVNQNYDGWPSHELRTAAHTFVGKPIFVNHQNSDPTKARGRVVAARYFENGADKGIECIMEVDAQRFPRLAHEIRTGGLDSVSMGAEAGHTICSMCGNQATDTHDMCDHVKFHKGEHLMKNGKPQLVYESCHKLGFFELSYVFDPADETAVVSKVIQASAPQKVTGKATVMAAIRQAFGETEAPQSVDTLRAEEPGSEEDFHAYVETPEELSDPNLDRTQQLDREQENEGLDNDRLVEDVEGYEAPDHAQNELLQQQMYAARNVSPVNNTGSVMNERRTREDATMARSRSSLASRSKTAKQGHQQHRKVAEGPLTDGGDQSVNAQSTREPNEAEFITPTPPEESVETADGGTITNTENNLVARMKHNQQQLLRDAARYQQLMAQKQQRQAAGVQAPGIASGGNFQTGPGSSPNMPDAGVGGAPGNVQMADDVASGAIAASRTARIAQKITWMEQRLGRRLTADESATVATSVPETADTVNPPLSGTDDQSLKGSDFQPADPNSGVQQTQPQDSKQSSRIWAAFDQWLQQGTGRTAAQIGDENYVMREARRFAQHHNFHPQLFFPTMGNQLRQMQARRANMQRRADTSLEVAAPGGRIDVEKPTSNTTDAEAQASQFGIEDFGRNAGDGLSDPDLSTDYVTWAPGEGKKEGGYKRASTASAVRCADLWVESGLKPAEDRYNLIASHETMRAGQVADRIAILELVKEARLADQRRFSAANRRVASGISRGATPAGIPQGLTGAMRTAGARKVSALEDHSTDGLMFL